MTAFASAAAQSVGTTVSPVPCPKPTGLAVGDVMIAFCWANNSTATWSYTSGGGGGWTAIGNNAGTGGSAFFRKIADAADVAAATFTFTRATNSVNGAGVIIARYTNPDPTNPVDTFSFGTTGAGTSVGIGTQTPAGAGNVLVEFASKTGIAADSFTPPGTATERVDTTAGGLAVEYTVADEVVGAGATGTRTFTYGSSGAARGGMVTLNPGPQTISPSGIASTAAVGTPSITSHAFIIPGGVASTTALGTPTVAGTLPPVQPGGVASTLALGSPTVVAGAAHIAPSGIASTAAFGTPEIVEGVALVGPTGIASTAALGAPEVLAGPVAVEPAGIASTANVGNPEVLPGPVLILPPGIASTAQVGNALVEPPVAVIHPAGIASTLAFGVTVLDTGIVAIRPDGIEPTSVVGDPRIVPGAILVQPEGIGSTVVVGDPVLVPEQILTPEGIAPTVVFGVAHINVATGPTIIRPPGIPSTAEVGEPTMTETPWEGLCWPVNAGCAAEEWQGFTLDQREYAARLAVLTLRTLTGYRVGNCPITVRPCRRGCYAEQTWQTFPVGSSGSAGNPVAGWSPALVSGSWVNLACGCGRSRGCSCSEVPEVVFESRIASVTEVWLDGEVLDPSAYRVDDYHALVRTDGEQWPLCQDMVAPITEPNTFAVVYTPGVLPGLVGEQAAGRLAVEYAKACAGRACALPAGVKSLARQGVNMEISADVFPGGRTGIREVDAFIDSVNPNRLKSPSRVFIPGRRAPRRTTFGG